MASPSQTVNDVFAWLNDLFGLHIPLLPLTGRPSIMKRLWNFLTGGEPPVTSPSEVPHLPGYHLLFEIPVEGELMMLPPGGKVDLKNLCIYVLEKDSGPNET
jgi:hypothetical protein